MYNILVKEKDAISELAEEDWNIRNSHTGFTGVNFFVTMTPTVNRTNNPNFNTTLSIPNTCYSSMTPS